MIQNMLAGVLEERKNSFSGAGGLLIDPSSSPTSSISSLSQSSSSSSLSSTTGDKQQNLRCPRCDSANTKFCYYNNYNLTQPRHFCKTCRRYWTKGGALRNVPIGGGCRKTKVVPVIATAGLCSKYTKGKLVSPDLLLRSSLIGGLENELSSSPILWALPPTSHLMSPLRSSSVQNPNPILNSTPSLNLNFARIKDDRDVLGSYMVAETGSTPNAHSLSLDPLSQLNLGASPWRTSNYSYQQQQQQQPQNNNILVGETPSSEIQDLYQRLKSSANSYNEQLQTVMNNVGSFDSSCSSTTTTMTSVGMVANTTSPIIEPIPLSVGEFGYWNLPLAWSDLPTPNGAFH